MLSSVNTTTVTPDSSNLAIKNRALQKCKKMDEKLATKEATDLFDRAKKYSGMRAYKKAFSCFLSAAKLGNVGAMYKVGICLRNGQGTPINIEQAQKWLEQAHRNRHIKASYILGNWFKSINSKNALKYFYISFKRGYYRAATIFLKEVMAMPYGYYSTLLPDYKAVCESAVSRVRRLEIKEINEGWESFIAENFPKSAISKLIISASSERVLFLLKYLPQTLTMLYTSGEYLENIDIKNLVNNRLPNLTSLWLCNSSIDTNGIKTLVKWEVPNLTSLNLEYTAVGDDGMAILKQWNLSKLESLNLQATEITPAGIKELFKGNLKKLTELNISGNDNLSTDDIACGA